MGNSTHVRDSRQPGHFWADNEIVDDYLPQIGVYGFAVYMLLAKYADAKTGQCDPSVEGMARKLNLSAPTVRKALDTLESEGLITIKRRRRERDGKLINQTSVYTLLAVDKRQSDAPGKRGLVPSDIDQGTQPDLPPLVNVVDQGTKGGLPGVLNHVSSNKTHENKKEGVRENPVPTLPAVDVYTRITGRQPIEVDLEFIRQVTDLAKWEREIKNWLASGYKAANVKGMLDWYHGQGRHQNGQRPAESRPPLEVKPFTPDKNALTPEQVKQKLREIQR